MAMVLQWIVIAYMVVTSRPTTAFKVYRHIHIIAKSFNFLAFVISSQSSLTPCTCATLVYQESSA